LRAFLIITLLTNIFFEVFFQFLALKEDHRKEISLKFDKCFGQFRGHSILLKVEVIPSFLQQIAVM
jgi:hypothetical protein